MAKKDGGKKIDMDSNGDALPKAHPAVVNKEDVISNIKKYVEAEREKRDPSKTVGSPAWSEKARAKTKAAQFPKQF